tara:strand:- start:564 stop:923 length:360 start_codon:yes stop_codon:yes gene_type:complete
MMKKYVNILGFKVEIKLIKKDLGEGEVSWYCAYVLLPKSRFLSDNCLNSYGWCTFRGKSYKDEDDDLVGADSNHTCHSGDSLDEKLMDVLGYIEEIIINYQKAVDKRYWEGSIVEGTNN